MNDDLSLRVILRIFLILEHFELRYSYKRYSYKKKRYTAKTKMSENWDIGKLGCLKNGASDERRRYGMSDKWHFGKLELKTILSVSSPTLVWELSEKWAVWEVECLESELRINEPKLRINEFDFMVYKSNTRRNP